MKTFRLAYVLVTALSCGTYGEQATSPAAADAAADASSDASPSDASLADTGLPDAAAKSCEVLLGTTLLTAASNVTALAADAVNVYWAGAEGVTRAAIKVDGASEAVFRGLGQATDVVVGDFVAARFVDGALRFVPKTDIAADASAVNILANGIDPRSAVQFFARRADRTFSCAVASATCAGVVEYPNVSSIAVAPTGGFDFMAREGAGSTVFHCPSNCSAPDAGVRLATASSTSAEVASDADYVYWIDRTAGEARKASRAGGGATAVMTALVEPVALAIDPLGRIVVVTLANGVFRGPKTGCVAPVTSTTAANATALALNSTTVLWAEGVTIKKTDQ